LFYFFFFSSRRRHTRLQGDWSSDVCSSDLLLDGNHEVLVAAVKQFAERCDADLAALLHSELRSSLTAYEDLKGRTGRLDFLDLRSEERRVGKECRSRRSACRGRRSRSGRVV